MAPNMKIDACTAFFKVMWKLTPTKITDTGTKSIQFYLNSVFIWCVLNIWWEFKYNSKWYFLHIFNWPHSIFTFRNGKIAKHDLHKKVIEKSTTRNIHRLLPSFRFGFFFSFKTRGTCLVCRSKTVLAFNTWTSTFRLRCTK